MIFFTDIDAAIAAAWPSQWARVNDPTRVNNQSKARNNLRKRWRAHLEFEQFKLAHPTARCGNCLHMRTVPVMGDRPSCDLDSDFHGYAMTTDDSVCIRHEGQH